MNRFKTTLSLFFITSLSPILLASQTISDGWVQLLSEHSGLAAQERKVAAMDAQLTASKALRLPDVSISGRWTTLDDEVGINFDTSSLTGQAGSVYIPVQDQQYFDAEITATLPLYTGGKLKAAALASEAELTEQKALQQQYVDDLFVTYVERYLSVSLAQKNASIRKLAAKNLQQHYNRAVRMYEEGTIAYTEQLQAQVERDKADRLLNQALVDARLAESAYQALFASSVDIPETNLLFIENDLDNISDIKYQSLTYAPVLKQIRAKQAQAEAGSLAIKSQWYPSVAAFAQYELFPDDLTELDPTWAAGIALEWHLFGRGNRIAESYQYAALEAAADYTEQQVRRDLSVLIEKTIFEVDSAKDAFNSLLSSKALAEENLRLQEKAFLQGVNTSLDIIDADVLVTGISLESQKTLFDFYLAQAKLSALVGEHGRFLEQLQLAQQPSLSQH